MQSSAVLLTRLESGVLRFSGGLRSVSAVPYPCESTQSSNQALPKSAFRVCRAWPLTELRGLLSSYEAAEFGVYCCYLLQLFFVSLVQNAQTRKLFVVCISKKTR